MMSAMNALAPPRKVSATLEADVTGPVRLELQLALPAVDEIAVDEQLSVVVDGAPVTPHEVVGEHGNRVHVLSDVSGKVTVTYAATATATGHGSPGPVTEWDRVAYTRPSRYAESDRLLGFATRQFGTSSQGTALLQDVSTWVGSRLSYVPGSSGPTDGATETLLAGQGVCRDYAHLVIGLLRALDVPARLVAVYAPGCDPMDFHAVVEAAVGEGWQVGGPPCRAPRQSMLRTSTGRDAADPAFLTNFGGGLSLSSSVVPAVVDGDLPVDDVRDTVLLG